MSYLFDIYKFFKFLIGYENRVIGGRLKSKGGQFMKRLHKV